MRRQLWFAGGALALAGGAVALWLGLGADAPRKSSEDAATIVLPSGLKAAFHEMLWNEPGEGLTYRFRFVAPALRTTGDVETVTADLQFLCTRYALPKIAGTGPLPGQVIISLADKPSEFGTFNPDVIQVFEAFDVRSGACIWEMF